MIETQLKKEADACFYLLIIRTSSFMCGFNWVSYLISTLAECNVNAASARTANSSLKTSST